MIDFKGEKVTISELSRRFGLSWSQIDRRYKKGIRGDELVAPTRKAIKVDFFGELLTFKEISERTGVPLPTVRSRYYSGCRNEDLFCSTHRGLGGCNAATKLDENTASLVKKEALEGNQTLKYIAKKYNIDPSHVSDIKNGHCWASVAVA